VDFLLFVLLAPLAAGAVVAARGFARDRDLRLFALLASLALLATRHFFAPLEPFSGFQALVGPSGGPLLVDLLANLAALLVTLITTQTLHERNRAEGMQWRSMETLRQLADYVHGAGGPLDEELPGLLALASERFGLETGLVLELDGDGVPQVRAVHCPDDVALPVGPAPLLRDTLAARALGSTRVIAIQAASEGHWSTHPEHAPFGWQSFFGVQLGEGQALCFASREERTERFSGVETSVLTLLADWIALRLVNAEQPVQELAVAPPGKAASDVVADASFALAAQVPPKASDGREPGRSDGPWRGIDEANGRGAMGDPSEAGAGLDPNTALREIRSALRRSIGHARELTLELDPKATPVQMTRARFERIAKSLVLHAAEAGPNNGAITLRTAALEPADGAPGTTRFTTLSVCARGAILDTDALAALYEGRGDFGRSAGQAALPLTRLVRVLRDRGCDLSLESEEGVGTTLTAYLVSQPLLIASGTGGAPGSVDEAERPRQGPAVEPGAGRETAPA
jgi:hypothetical protein